jgi:uncharacterized protein
MSRPCRAAALALAVLLPLGAALAAQFPPRPAARVTDLANLLAPDQRQILEDRLATFERETTHQVAVLAIPSLEGEPLESFSHQVATTWKLGRAGVDNGVLLLIVARDRKVRIEVGYGLEPSLPDGLAGAIIRESIAPNFRRGAYFQGINEAVDRIFTATRKADLASVPARRAMEARRGLASRVALYLLVGLGLFGLAHPFGRRFMGKGFWGLFGASGAGLAGGYALGMVPWPFLAGWAGLGVGLGVVEALVEEQCRCPRCGGWLRRSVAPAVARAGAAQEVVKTTCPRCGYTSRAVRAAALAGAAAGAATGFWFGSGGGGSGGGGGGGDSGFSGGGGDFGGGGAGGDW